MARDAFFGRPRESSANAYIEHYRVPNFREKMTHLWDPLLALNRAQSLVLHDVGILETREAADVLEAIDDLQDIDIDEFDSYEEFDGPYHFIENYVTTRLGVNVGGRLHTGRSRNDLYSAALRIAVRESILDVMDATLVARDQLLGRAEETQETIFPAFTHSQPAQPITFAHYLLAFDDLLSRDIRRLRRAFEETNRSPLGAAAIGGTGFPLDRGRLAELAGFSEIVTNTYDAIASVDYLPQTAAAFGMLMTNLSRVSQDLLVWSMFEVGFVQLSDDISSGSSIMPQKKNPSVIEKTRAKASESIAQVSASLTALKAVPYGDVGETTYSAFPLLRNTSSILDVIRLFAATLADVKLDEERMLEDAQESFCTMTELADTLVREAGISFRQAHDVVAMLVQNVSNDGRHAGEITGTDLDRATEASIGENELLTRAELEEALNPRRNVTRRDIVGGTAPERNAEALRRQRTTLDEQRTWLAEVRSDLDAAQEERTAGLPT